MIASVMCNITVQSLHKITTLRALSNLHINASESDFNSWNLYNANSNNSGVTTASLYLLLCLLSFVPFPLQSVPSQ